MKNLIEHICRLWGIDLGTKITNPRSNESILSLKKILKEDLGFNTATIKYIVDAIMRAPQSFKSGDDVDTSVYVDDEETAVSAILSDDELDALSQHSEFLEQEGNEDDEKEKAEDDIQSSSLTKYEIEKLGRGGMLEKPNKSNDGDE